MTKVNSPMPSIFPQKIHEEKIEPKIIVYVCLYWYFYFEKLKKAQLSTINTSFLYN